MILIAVDKDSERLADLTRRLEEAYPGAMIRGFFDFFLAAQYVNRERPEFAFIADGREYFEAQEFARLARVFNTDIRVFVVTDVTERLDTKNWAYISGLLTRPVTQEKLLALAPLPAVSV